MKTSSSSPKLGYSILRSGEGDLFEACLVFPHVADPSGISFDPISRRLDVICGGLKVSLPEVPADVSTLLTRTPEKVLLVTTDTLASIRTASRADQLELVH